MVGESIERKIWIVIDRVKYDVEIEYSIPFDEIMIDAYEQFAEVKRWEW